MTKPGAMDLRELLEQHFPTVESRFPFAGYFCKTALGGKVRFKSDGESWGYEGGADVRLAALRVMYTWNGGKPVRFYSPSPKEIAAMQALGRSIGIEVEACAKEGLFFDDAPPLLPVNSGAHGTQSLDWRDEHLRNAGLIGHEYGSGIRVGSSWETGAPLRYADEDSENHLLGIGSPGRFKGTAFEITAILESCGVQRGNEDEKDLRMSTVTIDPSGQLYSVCRPWLEKMGVRVIPIMPFTSGFPQWIVELGPTRCMNLMDLIHPDTEDCPSECLQLAKLAQPRAEKNVGDPFFDLSGQSLIQLFIGCVKLYSHPSEQNLCEVFHKISDAFAFARSLINKPGMPRWIKSPLQRLAERGADQNRTLQSIVETARAKLSWLGDEAIERVLRQSSFGWDHVKNGPVPLAIFILLPVTKLDTHHEFLALAAGAAMMGLGASDRGKRKVLLTIDEAGILGWLPLPKGYSELRKRGVALSCWFQSSEQIKKIYGQAAEELYAGSDLQIFLCPPGDLGTAESISKRLGTTTEILPHYSFDPRGGDNLSLSEHGRPVMFPQQLMGMPKKGPEGKPGTAAIVFTPGRSTNALKIWARPWFDDPELKDKGGIDPYHQHRAEKET